MTEKIIIGIDPGTNIMGYGVISVKDKKMSLLCIDELILHKLDSHALKLKKIFERTLAIIDAYHPDELAIEEPFYAKNVQSMLKLGRAQGVAMAAGLLREIPIAEYLPKKVKMAITGNGNASKEQVAGMLKNLLNIKEFPTKYLDATDGLALAVCHFLNTRHGISDGSKKSYSNWNAFVKNNPKRIEK
ncbi:MAG: crossover junction endodeoxyribonuclease RuvC [Flavobacteriaceae bacterium]|nr:crossover junction endodeoxyribonuclease RuvC [Flavobacteriaceae bacterium]